MRQNVVDYPVVRLMATNQSLDAHQLIQQNLAVLEMAQSAVAQLKKLPGRKIVVLVSCALIYNTTLAEAQIIKTRLNQLIEQANRAEGTFNLLSPSGMNVRVIGAARRLAEETGGRSIYNTNDVSIGFAEILRENSGYYLLSYAPEQETIGQPRQIKVRVKKPGLKVQTRSTVYRNEAASEKPDANESLLIILRSPLSTGDIKITLSPTFHPLAKTRGIIKTSLNIDPANLETETAAAAADGTRTVKIFLAIQVTGRDNRLVREEVKNFNLKFSSETWSKIQADGLVYQFETRINQAGYHRINVDVCVADLKRCGNASRFVNTLQTK